VGATPIAPATQRKLKNILFATDFSPASKAALPHAVAIAQHYGSRLYVAHAIAPEAYPPTPSENTEKVMQSARDDAQDKLQALAQSTELRDIPHESLLSGASEDGVVASLLQMIKSRHVDLVVVGTHGRRGVRRFLMGSNGGGVVSRRTLPRPHGRPSRGQRGRNVSSHPVCHVVVREVPVACGLRPFPCRRVFCAPDVATRNNGRRGRSHRPR
jgi:nucleotide-binding universal stress UspA family protein